MRALPLLVLVAAAAAFFVGPAISSNLNSGIPSFSPAERWTQSCNDQESVPAVNCVTDTTPSGVCAWGDEDDIADVAAGKLSAGQSTSDTLCLVTDPCSDYACPHMIDYTVTGNGLSVALTDDRGHTYPTPAPVKTKSGPAYQLCFADPLWPQFDASVLPEIPGTNGGYGLLTNYTLTITALKTTQMSAGFEIAQNDADGRFGYWHAIRTPCVWTR